jgi:DNA-binding transcriptional MerR regulator
MKTTDTTLLTSGAVSDRVRVTRSRLLYLIESGVLPGPSFQVPGRRLFTEDDIRRIETILVAQPELRGHPDGKVTDV